MPFVYFVGNFFLKAKAQADSASRSRRAKTVIVIILIENVLDRPVQPQCHFFLLKPERISARQIAFPVAAKTIDVGSKNRIAEYRRQIAVGRQKIKIHPRPFEPLRCDQCELVECQQPDTERRAQYYRERWRYDCKHGCWRLEPSRG